MDWIGYTRAGAQRVIDRFVELGILDFKNNKETYDRTYIYRKYLNIFIK